MLLSDRCAVWYLGKRYASEEDCCLIKTEQVLVLSLPRSLDSVDTFYRCAVEL